MGYGSIGGSSIKNQRDSKPEISPSARPNVTFKSPRRAAATSLDKGTSLNSYDNASRHQIESHCGLYTYHIAVIDYLQQWNFEKVGEAFLKRTLKGRPRDKISAVPPEQYQSRFARFVDSTVLTCLSDIKAKRAEQEP